jgi:hypothetical protein
MDSSFVALGLLSRVDASPDIDDDLAQPPGGGIVFAAPRIDWF